jgi:hypothetical protein
MSDRNPQPRSYMDFKPEGSIDQVMEWYISYWNDGPSESAKIVLPTLQRIKDDLNALTPAETTRDQKFNLKPWEFADVEVKLIRYDDLKECVAASCACEGESIDNAETWGGTDQDGKEVSYPLEKMLEGLNEQGIWGFAHGPRNTIHYWMNETADPQQIHWFLAHELAHLFMPEVANDYEEEMQAERIGAIAAKAHSLSRALAAGRSPVPEIPLCGSHADSWFTSRNHLACEDCVVCAHAGRSPVEPPPDMSDEALILFEMCWYRMITPRKGIAALDEFRRGIRPNLPPMSELEAHRDVAEAADPAPPQGQTPPRKWEPEYFRLSSLRLRV